MRAVLSTISLLFFINQAWAGCAPVDLNRSAPLSQMAVLDQDGTGICYAYAGAQLLEFKLRSEGRNITPSPIQLSAQNARHFATDLDGGFTDDVIASASPTVMENSCVENAISAYTAESRMTSAQFVYLVHQVYSADLDEEETQAANQSLAGEADLVNCDIPRVRAGLEAAELWGARISRTLRHVLLDCPRVPIPELSYEVTQRGSNEQIMRVLDQALDRGVPAGVHLCAEVFDGTDQLRVRDRRIGPRRPGGGTECGTHAVIATAKRSYLGQCQYMIRNSWGAHWRPPGIPCACRINDQYFEVCPSIPAINARFSGEERESLVSNYGGRVTVGCWFNKNALANNILQVGSIR